MWVGDILEGFPCCFALTCCPLWTMRRPWQKAAAYATAHQRDESTAGRDRAVYGLSLVDETRYQAAGFDPTPAFSRGRNRDTNPGSFRRFFNASVS